MIRKRLFRADRYIRGLRPIKQVPREFRDVYRETCYRAAKAAQSCGEVWTCNSSFRTYSEQVALYNAYKNGTGHLAAIPGTSRHESGRALDLSDPNGHPIYTNPRRRAALESRRLFQTVHSELWHAEYQP